MTISSIDDILKGKVIRKQKRKCFIVGYEAEVSN